MNARFDDPILTPGQLLELLASLVSDASATAQIHEANAVGALESVAARVGEHLELALSVSPPLESAEAEVWLEAVERLELSRITLGRVGQDVGPWASRLASELEEAIESRTRELGDVAWGYRFARRATELSTALGADVRPWSALRPGIPITPSSDLLTAWALDNLLDADAAVLRSRVADGGAWRDAYRAWLRDGLTQVPLETDQPTPVIQLPHLGRGQVLAARLEGDIVEWTWPSSPSPLRLALSAPMELSGDDITGPLPVSVLRDDPGPLTRVFRDLCALREAETVTNDDQRLAAARKAVSALGNDSVIAALRAASDLETEQSEDVTLLVQYALELRVRLEALAAQLLAPELFKRLDAIDASFKEFGPALALLDDEAYDEATSSGGVDIKEWWGWLEKRERTLPLDVVDVAVTSRDLKAPTSWPPKHKPGPVHVPHKFRRAAAERSSHAGSPSDSLDPGRAGEVIYPDSGREDPSVEVRVFEQDVPGSTTSRMIVRVAVAAKVPVDLSREGAVQLLDVHGLPIQISRTGEPHRQLFWAETRGDQATRVVVQELGLDIIIHTERPDA